MQDHKLQNTLKLIGRMPHFISSQPSFTSYKQNNSEIFSDIIVSFWISLKNKEIQPNLKFLQNYIVLHRTIRFLHMFLDLILHLQNCSLHMKNYIKKANCDINIKVEKMIDKKRQKVFTTWQSFFCLRMIRKCIKHTQTKKNKTWIMIKFCVVLISLEISNTL